MRGRGVGGGPNVTCICIRSVLTRAKLLSIVFCRVQSLVVTNRFLPHCIIEVADGVIEIFQVTIIAVEFSLQRAAGAVSFG